MSACPLRPKKGRVILGNLWIPQMLLEFKIKLLLSYKWSVGVNVSSAPGSHDGFSSTV